MNNLKIWSTISNYRRTIIFLIFIQLNNILVAQYNSPAFYRNVKIDSTKDNSLELRIENSNFLKNNEDFNDIVEGYTLIGYFLNPKLVYYPTKNTSIETGVHFLKYSGVDDFTKILPTFSFHYQPSKSIEIILGTLNGTANHELIEPIFKYEYYFTDNIENGLQFLFDNRWYKGDIWINWQQFIFKGEDKQEIFTAGLSNKIFITKPASLHSVSIPFSILYRHHGGEINEPSRPVTTRNNSTVGLNYTYQPQNSFIKSAGIESSLVVFKDMSSDYLLPYIMGYGIYTKANFKVSYFDLRVAHWYGDSYMSELGDPIFTSVSTYHIGFVEKKRALITSRLMFEKNIFKGLDVGAGFETNSDLYNYTMDYWYMFYINFNRDFFIKKFK